MYADKVTPSMAEAVEETQPAPREADRLQPERGIDPQPLRKKIADITDMLNREDADTEELLGSGRARSRGKSDGGRGGRGAACRRHRARAPAGPSRWRPATSPA